MKLCPIILDAIVQEAKDAVTTAIKVGARDPQAHLAKVEKKFAGLITRKARVSKMVIFESYLKIIIVKYGFSNSL